MGERLSPKPPAGILVVAALIAACGPRAPRGPSGPVEPLTAAQVVGEGRLVRAIAAGGDGAVWWTDADGVMVRAPGAEPRRVSNIAGTSLAVQGGVAWIGGADGVTRIGADGSVTRIEGIVGGEILIGAGAAGVYAAMGGTLYGIDGDRAGPRGATSTAAITALAVDDREVVWADWQDGGGAVRRIVHGGAPEQLARLSKPAVAIAIHGDAVVWTGDAVAIGQWSAGGERVRVGGAGIAIAADRDGVVVHSDAGLIVEHVDHPDGSEAAYVIDQARTDHDLSRAPIAIDGRAAYVVEIRPDGVERILANPRPGHGARLVAIAPGPVRQLVRDEHGGLIAAWAAAGGAATQVGTIALTGSGAFGDAGAAAGAIAAHGGELWVVDGDSNAIRARATAATGAWREVAKPAATPAGLVVTEDAAYWIDGAALWRMPKGAAPQIAWKPQLTGAVAQPSAAFAVMADGTIVTTGGGFTVEDLTAIGPDGKPRVLVAMTEDRPFGAKVVADGTRAYYVVGGAEVWGVEVAPGATARPVPVKIVGPGNDVIDVAAGGGFLYAAVMIDGVAHVVRSSGTDAKTNVDLGVAPGLVPGTMVAGAEGVTWASASAKAILRFEAPAPR